MVLVLGLDVEIREGQSAAGSNSRWCSTPCPHVSINLEKEKTPPKHTIQVMATFNSKDIQVYNENAARKALQEEWVIPSYYTWGQLVLNIN